MRPGSRYDQKVWEREAEVEAEPARLLLERETIIGSYFNSESQYPVSGLYHRVINSLCMYVHTWFQQPSSHLKVFFWIKEYVAKASTEYANLS